MEKLEFMKLGEGDVIYVPYIITERRGDDLVEAVSPAILDEEQGAVEFCHRDVRCAEGKRRRFKSSDLVRVDGVVWLVEGDEENGLIFVRESAEGGISLPVKDVELLMTVDEIKALGAKGGEND